jgi:hypothetical protein
VVETGGNHFGERRVRDFGGEDKIRRSRPTAEKRDWEKSRLFGELRHGGMASPRKEL